MIKYKQDVSLSEWIEQANAAIETEKALSRDPGFLIVSEIDPEDIEGFVSEFKGRGFYVSEPTTTNKIAIVWNEKALDGFMKSGYSFG